MPGVTDLASAWGHEGTRTTQGSGIIYVTEKPDRQHQLSMRSAQILGYQLTLVEASLFRVTGWFHIHLFFINLRFKVEETSRRRGGDKAFLHHTHQCLKFRKWLFTQDKTTCA